jgi:hypothetical protein
MCMALYLGSSTDPPIIEFDEKSPSFNTKVLEEKELGLKRHFSLINVIYIGSDEGCGCGFNHALLDDNGWLPVINENQNNAENQRKLFEYINASFYNQEYVEIYGVWNGDPKLKPVINEEIDLELLLHPDFFFKEQGFYKVNIKNNR